MTPTGFDSLDATISSDKDLRDSRRSGAAKSGAVGPSAEPHGAGSDPDLARLIAAWPALPTPICNDFGMVVLALNSLPAEPIGSPEVVCMPDRLVQYFRAPDVVKEIYGEVG
jgi:hypothetical protein